MPTVSLPARALTDPSGQAAVASRALPRLLFACLASLIMAGCSSSAQPRTPAAAPIPAHWPALADTTASAGNASDMAWQDYFHDPLLQQLISTALENNRDLRIAILRTEQARAAFNIQRAGQFPELGITAQGARSRVPGDLNLSGQSVVASEYRAEVGLNSWELDLWGRVRSLKTSALEQWLATEAGQHATELVLIAQVADGYLLLRELKERVALAQRSLHSRQESLRIFSRRHEVGSASQLEVTQVQTLLTQAQSLLAQLEQARASARHALGVLVGADPGPLPASGPFDETLIMAQLEPGLPSDLLHARPDLIAAEHRLHAADADIAAARAAFFPRIALVGGLGSASSELDGLFAAGSRAWSFAPVLSLPIFDGGRRRANLSLSEVRKEIAVAEYELRIQHAFREVADALAARHWLQQQRDIAAAALQAQSERARLAQLRYDNGATSYLEVLDSQRDLLSAEQQLVQSRRALLSSQVALYAALGGGTLAKASPPPATPPSSPLSR